jgi:hypothetical protein
LHCHTGIFFPIKAPPKFLRNKITFNEELKTHFLSKLNANYRCVRLLCLHCHPPDRLWYYKQIFYLFNKKLLSYIALSIYTLKLNSLRSWGIVAMCVHWLPTPTPRVVPCQSVTLGVPYPPPTCNTHPPVPAILPPLCARWPPPPRPSFENILWINVDLSVQKVSYTILSLYSWL